MTERNTRSRLEDLDAELAQVEESLRPQSSSNNRGRGFMNSIASSLAALRGRFDNALAGNNSRNTAQQLGDRLANAQLAFSSRRPLEAVRQAPETTLPQLPPNPPRMEARLEVPPPSIAMASRASPTRRSRSVGSLDLDRNDGVEEEIFSRELHEQANKRARTLTHKKPKDEAPPKTNQIPGRVLLTRAQSHDVVNSSIVSVLGASSRSMAAVDPTAQEPVGLPGTIVYSWGLQSLHDDEHPRTAQNSKLTQSSRLGKPGTPALTAFACGEHQTVCASLSGSVYACGQNDKGCVDPSNPQKYIIRPCLLEPIRNMMGQQQTIRQLSCGLDHTAAVTSNGTVLSWGSNQQGQLGHRMQNHTVGGDFCSPQGMVLGSGQQAAAVACGHYFTLVLTNRMCLLACGVETIAPNGSPTPTTIPSLQGLPLVFVTAGHNHAVVLTSSGTPYAWGLNDSGCCGRSFPNQFGVPVEMNLPETETANQIRASATSEQSSACTDLTTTTSNKHHPFRNWASKWQPKNSIVVPDASTNNSSECVWESVMSIADELAVVHAACGQHHTVLVTRSGRLLVCGSNQLGQLGLSLSAKSTCTQGTVQPVYHPYNGTFVSAEAGNSHTLLLDSRGDVWQMGSRHCEDSHGNAELLEGLECVLQGRSILGISSGGEGNNIAVAQGAVTPRGGDMRPGVFPIAADGKPHCNNLLSITAPISDMDNKGDGSEVALESLAIVDNLDDIVETLAIDRSSRELANGGSSRELAAAAEIAKRTEELLQNPAVMNSLFFGPRELDVMYLKLMSITGSNASAQRTILTAMERGIEKGLRSLLPDNPDDARMIYPEAVRCLLVYIRFFDRPPFLEAGDETAYDLFDDSHDKLIALLMETILSLPFEGYKAFLKWATSIYTGDLFIKMLVQPLLYQLEKSCRVTIDNDQVMHISIGPVPLIVSVLQWLYDASERLGIAKPEDFYCKAFDKIPVEALYHDLSMLKKARNAQKGGTQFFMCESPFLLSPSTKRNLLRMENQMEMMKAAYNEGMTFNAATGQVTLDAFFKLEIDRNDMLNQTLAEIKKAKPSDLRKSLRVKFRGEVGVDAGGVTKEFFQLLSEELFDVSRGMWSDKYGDNITWFNSNCMWDDVGYELTGILVGLALYNSVLLDVHFPMAVYRKLLGYPLGLEDMVDLELKRGLRQLLDYEAEDVEDIFCLTFEVTWVDDLGEERKRELKPGGSEIPVTSENKEEYVRLYVAWVLVDSIYPQWVSFETGVLRVLEGSSIGLCRPEEVELLVVGSPELDFDALEANTTYEGGYSEDSETIKSFWLYIKGIDRDAQTNFLKFATGSPKAPIGGLGELKFKIQRAGPDSAQLPTSHTCFNTLILPDYGTDEKLSELMGRAIVECEGFGLE